MKNILLLLLTINVCYGQTVDEIIKQKETQKKYLLEQIVALRTYMGYVQQGYTIAQKGLTTIKGIKKGDFDQHSNFFTALSAVNPAVKKYSTVASIIALQLFTAKLVHKTVQQCSGGLTKIEINYLQQVFTKVLDGCADNLEELIALLTDHEQQMTDDERIQRIDKLYADMLEKQIFIQSFSREAKGLLIQRRNEQIDIQIEKKLNGIR